MDWFYDYTATVYKYNKNHKDNTGLFNQPAYEKDVVINCDVQPSSSEKIEQSYGYKVQCTKVIYSDEEIPESAILKIGNKYFQTTKSIPWDDYCITTIIDYTPKAGVVIE